MAKYAKYGHIKYFLSNSIHLYFQTQLEMLTPEEALPIMLENCFWYFCICIFHFKHDKTNECIAINRGGGGGTGTGTTTETQTVCICIFHFKHDKTNECIAINRGGGGRGRGRRQKHKRFVFVYFTSSMTRQMNALLSLVNTRKEKIDSFTGFF